MSVLAFILYLSGCSCCPSGSLIGCVRPGGGPGRTGWASRVRTGRRSELSPCSSSPSPRDGSRGQGVAGPSGCPSSCWRCGSLSSCTEEHKHTGEEVSGRDTSEEEQTEGLMLAQDALNRGHLYIHRRVHPFASLMYAATDYYTDKKETGEDTMKTVNSCGFSPLYTHKNNKNNTHDSSHKLIYQKPDSRLLNSKHIEILNLNHIFASIIQHTLFTWTTTSMLARCHELDYKIT